MDTVEAIVKVLAVGLVLGAGLPAVFALGMRLLATGDGNTAADGTSTGRSPAAKVAAYVLFALLAAVIVVSILWITRGTIDYYFDIALFPFAGK